MLDSMTCNGIALIIHVHMKEKKGDTNNIPVSDRKEPPIHKKQSDNLVIARSAIITIVWYQIDVSTEDNSNGGLNTELIAFVFVRCKSLQFL